MAYDWSVESTVRLIQPTYMPNIVSFQINDPGGSCSAGAWLSLSARGDTEGERIANANATYSALIAALMSGNKVKIYGANTGCVAEFVHVY